MDIQALIEAPLVQRVLVDRRRRRARFLLSKVRTFPRMRVLDVGCGIDGASFEVALPSDWRIVGIDLLEPSRVRIAHPGFTYIRQDARDLSRFRDKEFDLAVSVGMMEHICDRSDLEKMAAELARVAAQLVVVVPWRYAWLEPHFKLPFFQLLPFQVQRTLVRLLNPQNHAGLAKDSEAYRAHLDATYQWLPTAEWKRIFRASDAYLSPTLETLVVVRS